MLKRLFLLWAVALLALWNFLYIAPNFTFARAPGQLAVFGQNFSATPPAGVWSNAQIVSSQGQPCSASSQTCALTVAATGLHNVGVIFTHVDANNTLSSISGGGTWVVDTGQVGCHHYWASGTDDVNCAYNFNLTAGVTTITVTWSSATPGVCGFIYDEKKYTGATPTLDAGAAGGYRIQSPGTHPVAGVTLAISGTNDLIVQAQSYGAPTSIAAPYGNFTLNNNGNGLWIGDYMNTSSGTASSWNYSGDSYALLGAIALVGN